MEFYIFAVVLIIAVIVIPIITLVSISSIDRKLREIDKKLNSMKEKPRETYQYAEPETVKEPVRFEPVVETKPIVETKPVIETQPIAEPEPVEVIKQPVPEPVAAIVEEPEIPDYFPLPETKTPVDDTVDDTPKTPEPRPTRGGFFALENLLSKIGIVTLVLGIAFFVRYAIDKDWINEVGRVAIGVFTAGVIIAVAHKLRDKYNVFSAILVGGGISVLYITITLAFREYHLFSQTIAFIILIAITLFSVLLSLLYNRKELALFSLLGGYASPLMISTGEGNYIVLFTFILILNTGMLLVSMRRKWNQIGIVSFICTQAFYWVWLISSFENQYTGALTYAILFFVQFYLLALFDHFQSNKNVSPFQALIILTNNLSLFGASILIFKNTGYRIEGLITISMSVINAIVMLLLFKRANIDKKLIYLIIAIVLSFVSLAVPVQLNGHVITMFWAAEMVILLWLWLRSGIKVFRTGFMLIALLTLVSYIMDVHYNYNNHLVYDQLAVVFNRIFITGLVVVAALGVCQLLLYKMKPSQDYPASTRFSRYCNIALILMAYVVPLLELHFQLARSPYALIGGFIIMMCMVYTALYVGALSFIYRKQAAVYPAMVYSLFGFMLFYSLLGLLATAETRDFIFGNELDSGVFLLHYLAFPGLIYIVYLLVSNLKTLPHQRFVVLSWMLVAACVAILSVELNNSIALFASTSADYSELMFDVHTFGYPILWGLIAMGLMIWGLRRKEVILRKISLVFFGLIVLKFYINDIWVMSQTGRIISFVALGIILLLVSFLLQKIKILIQDDHEDDNQ